MARFSLFNDILILNKKEKDWGKVLPNKNIVTFNGISRKLGLTVRYEKKCNVLQLKVCTNALVLETAPKAQSNIFAFIGLLLAPLTHSKLRRASVVDFIT